MGQVKFVEDSLWKILLGPFLDNLTHLKKQLNTKTCDIEFAKRISQKWKKIYYSNRNKLPFFFGNLYLSYLNKLC